MNISIDDHPILDAVLLHTRWPSPLGQINALPDFEQWFQMDAASPMSPEQDIKTHVRDLLRHGGFKPSGRSKPASEYLISAVEKGRLGSINAAVDCCNVASLHSGLPISVIDAGQSNEPWRIGIAQPDTSYVFNPTGQVISIGGLVVLFDADGACAGPVKDSQRTKTHSDTVETLSVIWGTRTLPGRAQQTAEWYTELMVQIGAIVTEIRPTTPSNPHA